MTRNRYRQEADRGQTFDTGASHKLARIDARIARYDLYIAGMEKPQTADPANLTLVWNHNTSAFDQKSNPPAQISIQKAQLPLKENPWLQKDIPLAINASMSILHYQNNSIKQN